MNVDVVVWSLERLVNMGWYRYRILLLDSSMVIGSWFDNFGDDQYTYYVYNYETVAEARQEAVQFTAELEADQWELVPGQPMICEVYTNGDAPFAFVGMTLPSGDSSHGWGELWDMVVKYGMRMDDVYR